MDRAFYEFVLASNVFIESQKRKSSIVSLNQIHDYELFSTRNVAFDATGQDSAFYLFRSVLWQRHECSILAFNITSHKAGHLSVRAFPLYI